MKKLGLCLAAGTMLVLPGLAQAAEILACSKYAEWGPPPPPPHAQPAPMQNQQMNGNGYNSYGNYGYNGATNRPWMRDQTDAGNPPPPPHRKPHFPPAPNTQLVCAKDASNPFYSNLTDLASHGWMLKTAVSSPEAYTFYLERAGWEHGKDDGMHHHHHHTHDGNGNKQAAAPATANTTTPPAEQ